MSSRALSSVSLVSAKRTGWKASVSVVAKRATAQHRWSFQVRSPLERPLFEPLASVEDLPTLEVPVAEEVDPVEEATEVLLDSAVEDREPISTLAIEDRGCVADVLSIVEEAEELALLTSAIQNAEAVQELLGDEDVILTLFAPTDAAFEDVVDRLGITLQDLLAQTEVLTALLSYHVVLDVSLTPADLRRSRMLETALQDYSLIGGSEDEIEAFASTAGFVGSPVAVCRSVIYVVDEVLLPEATLEDLVNEFAPVTGPVPEQETTPRCREGFNAFFAISSDDTLSVFAELLNLVELSGPLAGDRPEFTVFAPTNAAFDEILEILGLSLAELSTDEELLESILRYHIIRGENWEESDIPDGVVDTWNGTALVIEVDGGVVLSGVGSGASVLDGDIDLACTAAVHKINGVLLPFRSAPSATPTVTSPAAGGRGRRAAPGEQGAEPECQVGTRDLFQVLSSTPGLLIWSQIIQLAGMRSIFTDKSISVTMFAPSDAAFGILLPPNVGFSELVADEELARVLVSYHTVAGAATTRQIETGIKVDTLLTNAKDKPVKLSVEDNPFGIIDLQIEAEASLANVVETDIIGCNSVIHVIDTVLLPYEDFFPSELLTVEEAVEKAEDFGSILLEANEEEEDEEEEDEPRGGRTRSARS